MYEGKAPVQKVDPPCRVEIDLRQLWPPSRLRWGSDTPPWARAQGVQLTRPVIGYLTAWVMSSCGDWLGQCYFSVGVGDTEVALTHLVPMKALKVAEAR